MSGNRKKHSACQFHLQPASGNCHNKHHQQALASCIVSYIFPEVENTGEQQPLQDTSQMRAVSIRPANPPCQLSKPVNTVWGLKSTVPKPRLRAKNEHLHDITSAG